MRNGCAPSILVCGTMTSLRADSTSMFTHPPRNQRENPYLIVHDRAIGVRQHHSVVDRDEGAVGVRRIQIVREVQRVDLVIVREVQRFRGLSQNKNYFGVEVVGLGVQLCSSARTMASA